jgi:hypothetical protein
MNLQNAIAENASAMQQGVCAIIAASKADRRKIRPWVWLNLAA